MKLELTSNWNQISIEKYRDVRTNIIKIETLRCVVFERLNDPIEEMSVELVSHTFRYRIVNEVILKRIFSHNDDTSWWNLISSFGERPKFRSPLPFT